MLRTDFRHWLFDLDGTLIDSELAHERAFLRTLSRMLPDQVARFRYRQYRGMTTRSVVQALGVSDATLLDEIVRFKTSAYLEEVAALGSHLLFPGAEKLLRALTEHGRECYLVTGASPQSVARVLEVTQIGPYFKGTITSADVRRGKPDPESYRCALETFSLDNSSCIAIEDSPAGIQAAKGCRLPVVEISSEASGLGDFHFSTLSALAEAIAGVL